MDNENSQRIICVCSKCGEHDSNSSLEFNFREQKIYQVCSKCKNINSMEIINNMKLKPYPKSRAIR